LEEFAILYLEGCSDDKNVESKSQQTSENLWGLCQLIENICSSLIWNHWRERAG
jgi:hypothetical protein